jgi:exodeoxyribonuclease VII large subunit
LAARLLAGARGRLGSAQLELRGRERLVAGFGPERTLRRGYSITRSADGRLVTDARQVAVGQRLVTQLAAGTIASRVEPVAEE